MTIAEYIMAAVPVIVILLRIFGPMLAARWPALDKPIRVAQRAAPDLAGAYNVASGKWDPSVLARGAYEAYEASRSGADEAMPWGALPQEQKDHWVASTTAIVSLKQGAQVKP
jgi:hypothetical protein